MTHSTLMKAVITHGLAVLLVALSGSYAFAGSDEDWDGFGPFTLNGPAVLFLLAKKDV